MSKRVIGSEVGSYSFDPVGKVVSITGMTALRKEQVSLIVNTTTGGIIYNFVDPTNYGGTFLGNAMTFTASSLGMAASDNLMIVVDVDDDLIGRASEAGEGRTADYDARGTLDKMLHELHQIRLCMEALTGVSFDDDA